MEIGEKFENLQTYNKNMTKGLEDKLFFLEHLPKETGYVFVDFGCADGTLVDSLYHSLNNFNQYIGFDISEQMIDLALTKMSESPKNVMFTSNWNDVENKLTELNKYKFKKVLILSSVVHEVYSYARNEEDIDVFWKRVLKTGFDYICVRDMMVSSDTYNTPTDPSWINNINWDANHCVLAERRKQFVDKWGSIENKQVALHYLLKYRWQINWEREVNENYFPIDIENFLKMFEGLYNIDYFQRFTIPFIKDAISKDLYIFLGDTDFTHIKAIFSKRSI